jgi:nicotinamidase/pyrazinamidase
MPADPIRPRAGDALILVDVQLDFLPGGSLAVPRGDEVVPALNRYIAVFRRLTLPVVATRDWHPPDHCSFKAQGGPWPPHCVAGSDGARFAALLDLPCEGRIVSKATTRDKDAYSGFEGTDLDDWLKRAGVSRVFVGGLATDYCVLNTVRDALRLGYATFLLLDAVRAVDVAPGDGDRAIDEMLGLGARAMRFEDVAA